MTRPLSRALAVFLAALLSLFALPAALLAQQSEPPPKEKEKATDEGDDDEPAAPPRKPEDALPLEAGKPYRGFVSTSKDGETPTFRAFRFEVPAKAVVVCIDLEGRGDVDLFVAREPLDDYEAAIAHAADTIGTESLRLARGGDPALETGRYYVDVVYRREEPPESRAGKTVDRIPFTLTLSIHATRQDGSLKLGDAMKGAVGPETGGLRTYLLEVPATADAVRLDLVAGDADLDMRVRRAEPIVEPDDADATAATGLPIEELVLSRSGDPALEAGTYYVDVFDPMGLEWPIPFELRASLGSAAPKDLLAFPELPRPKTPLERARLATVELTTDEAGGSGVLLSEKGFLVTNFHVVQEFVEGDGKIGGPLYVSVTLDPREPPVPLFQAEVVAHDRDLDLALCRCTLGRYGQPLPAGFRFPAIELSDAASLALGDPLFALGYPSAGGVGSRVSVTLTRGIVSGFEWRGASLHMKTDAEINSGNSGGAALDERYRLVGFPTETISDDGGNGQVGFIRPIWLIPPAWLEQAGLTKDAVKRPERKRD